MATPSKHGAQNWNTELKDIPWHSWGSPVGLSIFFVLGLGGTLLIVGVFLNMLHEAGLLG